MALQANVDKRLLFQSLGPLLEPCIGLLIENQLVDLTFDRITEEAGLPELHKTETFATWNVLRWDYVSQYMMSKKPVSMLTYFDGFAGDLPGCVTGR